LRPSWYNGRPETFGPGGSVIASTWTRLITTPFGLYDCDVPGDGAVAVIVSAVDAARDLARPPVLVEAAGTQIIERLERDQSALTHEPQVLGQAARLWPDAPRVPVTIRRRCRGILMVVSNIREDAPAGLDTTIPNVARMYDYLLGGKDNFAADRVAAEQLLAVIPDVAAIAADNRAFLGRAVRYLTSQGVRQFLDLGSGLPTRSNVHEVAQRDAPDTRVVYVDYDPVVALHGKALLATSGDVVSLHADLTDPSSILEHPDLRQVLDLSQPVGLICLSTLHFVPDEADPWGVIAQYRDRLSSGSYLTITHAPARVPGEDPEDDEENAAQVFRQTSAALHMRTLAEIQRLFDGFELVTPGVVFMQDWRPDPGTHAAGRLRSFRAGVGRKP
jgi:S-adenosyl methyltransferase